MTARAILAGEYVPRIRTAHDHAALVAAHANALDLVGRASVPPAVHAKAIELLCDTTNALDEEE